MKLLNHRPILVADLLCGAGGSSTGCEQALRALGYQMELVCLNHWRTAIQTHSINHPKARHICQDIATVRPSIVCPEGFLDLLMASPSCTHHSVARGGRPTSDQQRSDPWHIITWLTELRVDRMIIENVWEFIKWGPVDPTTGKPIKQFEGDYFRAWIDLIRRLGFEPEWRRLNAADYGEATTRQRFILMARNDRKRVLWPTITHTELPTPGKQLWRPARDIIDWNIKGKSIFERRKPLARATLERIFAGAVKFQWPEPFLVILRNHMDGKSVDGPVPTIAANGQHIGLAQPIMLANRTNNKAKNPSKSPVPGLTTAHGGGIAIAEPVIVNTRHSKAGAGPRPRSTKQPLATVTSARGSQFSIAEPVIVNGRKNNKAKGVNKSPVPALDTKGGVWLAEPFILNRHGDNGGVRAHSIDSPAPTADCRGAGYVVEPFVLSSQSNGAPRSSKKPLPAVTANGGPGKRQGCARPMLIEPSFILSRQGGGAPRSTRKPTPTQVAKHSHALISPYYGSGSGETCSTVETPLPTATAKARFGLVVPVTHSGKKRRSRSVAEPLPVVTTAHRGELALAEPAWREYDMVGKTGVTLELRGGEGYDILFRMLEPHELGGAMGFDGGDTPYEFAGTKTEQVKQIGNAVSVKQMRACVSSIMAD